MNNQINESKLKPIRILFQGDSVTDEERDRSNPHHLGKGYAKFCAQSLITKFPARELKFINLGISGNKSEDLLRRWKTDCIDIKPDIVCLMIGINDVWHSYSYGLNITPTEYADNCRQMLEDLKKETYAKIILMEPFLLDNPEKPFRGRLDPNIDILRTLAKEYADLYIPLDGMITAAAIEYPEQELTYDGVHPKEYGAKLIGEWSASAIEKIINKYEL